MTRPPSRPEARGLRAATVTYPQGLHFLANEWPGTRIQGRFDGSILVTGGLQRGVGLEMPRTAAEPGPEIKKSFSVLGGIYTCHFGDVHFCAPFREILETA